MTSQVASASYDRAHSFSVPQPAENTSRFAATTPLPVVFETALQSGPQKFENFFRASPVQYCSFHPIGSASLQNGLQYISDTFSPSEKVEFFRQCLESRLENVAECLIDQQVVDLNMKDRWNRTILFYLASYGFDRLLGKILQKAGSSRGIVVNEQDRLGNTSLLIAVEKGYEQCGIILVKAGANWEISNCQGSTPLNVAFSRALLFVKICFQKGLIRSSPGFLNLYYQLNPVQRKTFECVDVILNATKIAPSCCKFFYFDLLLKSRDYELMKAMVEKEVITLVEKNSQGGTLLHYSVLQGYAPLVHFLIAIYKQKSVNLDACDSYQRTALHWACEKGEASCIELLMRNGADCNRQDYLTYTPLSLLVTHCFPLGKKYLLKMKQKGGLDVTPIIVPYLFRDVYQRREIDNILPMEELLQSKQLAQIWGIKGEMQWDGIRMSYEGCYWNVLLKIFFDAMVEFLACIPQNACYQHLREKVQELSPNFDLPLSQLVQNPSEIVQSIAQGKRVIYPLQPLRHVAYLLLTKDRLYVCDRGGLGCGAGVISYKIHRPENLTKCLETISSLQDTDKLYSYLQVSLPQDLEWEKIDCLPQKSPRAGNCTAGSAKSLMLALLCDEALQQQDLSREEVRYISSKTYKCFTAWSRIHFLQDYLQKSGYKDAKLLGAIKQKLCNPARLRSHFPVIGVRVAAVRDIQKAINCAAEDQEV